MRPIHSSAFIRTALSALTLLALIPATGLAKPIVRLDVQASNPVLMTGEKQTLYLKIGLTGEGAETERERPPINVAIVLDKSGSMQGDGKIEEARRAAVMALNLLRPDDVVSVVTYDSSVNVLVPATKLSDREQLVRQIMAISPGGNTALFAGVSKGADELRKFAEREKISRIILLSDGLANVGPSAPGDLAELGESLRKEGVSVSTVGLGLGYNEDLMTQLASRSDGNHYFVENARDLASIYERELGRVEAVVAKGVRIDIQCADGVRPVRVLGREAEIADGRVWLDLNQVFTGFERAVLLEVEAPAGKAGSGLPLADVSIRYHDVFGDREDRQEAKIAATYSDSREAVQKAVNGAVMVPVVELIAVENNQKAMFLRDRGEVEAAQKVLYDNSGFLRSNGEIFDSKKLKDYAGQNEIDAQNLDGVNYERNRKQMQETQNWKVY
jgi:Ca-activated chloride channel family protein